MPNRNIAPRITPLSTPSLLPYQCLILANGTEIFYLNDPLQEVFKIDVVFEESIINPNPWLPRLQSIC